jgi:signal recognition particle receptor subunit beta
MIKKILLHLHIVYLLILAFNYEKIEAEPYEAYIWDIPGKENLRIFWPNFYRNILFHGVIYLINYDSKDTLDEAVQVMHDLLNEDELRNVVVLVILNYKKRDYNEIIENNINIDIPVEENDKKNCGMNPIIVSQMKKDILFDLIQQKDKDLYYMDLYEEHKDSKIKDKMKEFIGKLL